MRSSVSITIGLGVALSLVLTGAAWADLGICTDPNDFPLF